MWPFAKRGTRADIDAAPSDPVALPPDLSALGRNDACIKLWLPEKLTMALDNLSATQGMSRPDVLRWLMFEHIYGRPAFERLKAWKQQKDADEEARRQIARSDHGVKFSPARCIPSERAVTHQLLGKSIEDFKLWLPSLLKEQLARLANIEGLGLSDYLRKTLVRILLGEAFHHQWRAAIGKLPREIQLFEQSPDI